MRICIVGASGKLGKYLVQHALDREHEVVAVCREKSVGKLAQFEGRITIVPGATDDREVIERAVAGCDGLLVVLVPRGVHGYSSGTAQAVLDHAQPGARLVFSCGWHITRDGQDVYSWKLKAIVKVFGPLARLARFADLDDQVEACRRVFASDTRWTVVRGSDLEEGESQGLPVWSPQRGRPRPREQHHAPRGLRPVHGGGPRERRSRSRGPRDRQPPEPFGARARRRLSPSACDLMTIGRARVHGCGLPTHALPNREENGCSLRLPAEVLGDAFRLSDLRCWPLPQREAPDASVAPPVALSELVQSGAAPSGWGRGPTPQRLEKR